MIDCYDLNGICKNAPKFGVICPNFKLAQQPPFWTILKQYSRVKSHQDLCRVFEIQAATILNLVTLHFMASKTL